MADPRMCTRSSSCLCDSCTPRRIRALSSSSTETQRQFLQRASSFSSLPFPGPSAGAAPSYSPHFEHGESSRARSPPSTSPSPSRSASFPAVAGPSSPTARRVSFDQAGAAADPGPSYDDRPHRLYAATAAACAGSPPPPRARAVSSPPPVTARAASPPAPPPRAASQPAPPVDINDRTPEEEAAAFQLPQHVSDSVVGLRDGIAYVFRHIQGCSPRRKETMREAVQKVIDYFDASISYQEKTLKQLCSVNNFEKGIAIENELLTICTICQELMEGEFPLLPCEHRFHMDCLESHFKTGQIVCPNCRSKLT